VPTTASGCTSKPSVVASPIANFPLLPADVDPALKTEPVVTIPGGAVPTKTEVKDIVVGTGATVGAHDSVTVNYLGLNYVDCSEFDSSWSRDTPATFSLDGVVPGFSKGIGGDSASGIAPMKIGGRREIIVTPADGYGTTGSGAIKPNEELVFVVDVLAASAPSASPSASGSATPTAAPTAATPSVTPSPAATSS
jgi:peptidylprolyl isomerase